MHRHERSHYKVHTNGLNTWQGEEAEQRAAEEAARREAEASARQAAERGNHSSSAIFGFGFCSTVHAIEASCPKSWLSLSHCYRCCASITAVAACRPPPPTATRHPLLPTDRCCPLPAARQLPSPVTSCSQPQPAACHCPLPLPPPLWLLCCNQHDHQHRHHHDLQSAT